jgi:PAS domain S-box-containing protein
MTPDYFNETERLKSLLDHKILDTAKEPAYDRITELASYICQTPIALISLIDRHRQWFKSRHGLEARETPRDQAFCDHAIKTPTEIFEVFDASKDFRFSDNPLVTGDPNIRFYAGQPLKAEDGSPLGTLCVISDKPGQLSDSQKQMLKNLALQVEDLLKARYDKEREKQARNLFQDIIESAEDIIFEIDENGEFLYLNNGFTKTLGYKLGARKIDPSKILTPDSIQNVRAFYKQQLKARKEKSYFEYEVRTADGSIKTLGQNVTMHFNDQGWMYKATGIARDISAKQRLTKELEQSKEKLDRYSVALQLFNQISSRIDVDYQQRIKLGLETVCNFLKMDLGIVSQIESETYGVLFQISKLGEKIPEELPLKMTYCERVIGQDKVVAIDDVAESSLKDHVCYENTGLKSYIAATYFVGDEKRGTVNFSQMNTRNRPFDEYDKDFVEVFARWVGSQIHNQETLEEINRSALAKQEFLSTMSHEIRTPMNSIIGATNLLLNDNPTSSQLENLLLLKYSGENLLVLINDILDLSKIEAGKVDLETINFDLRYTCKSVIKSLEYNANEKGIKLKLIYDEDLGDYFVGDPVRLAQVLTNLVSNAVKFTESGKVKLTIESITEAADFSTIRFEVMDTGIGISEESIEKIFESFSQANSATTRKYGGTGLGLSIVKNLLQLMGAEIQVTSQLRQGTTFWFDLSLPKALNAGVKNKLTGQPKKSSDLSKLDLQVLIVDDNRANQMIAGKTLAGWGVNYEVCGNGKEAVEEVQKVDYDLVLMDLHMPELDGYEATKVIRNLAQQKYKELPIIALTASVLQSSALERLKEFGLNDSIFKPFNPNELYEKILQYAVAERFKRDENLDKNPEGPGTNTENILNHPQKVSSQTILSALEKSGLASDTDFIKQLLDQVSKGVTEFSQNFERALKRNDSETIHRVDHKVGSSLKLIGVEGVSELVKVAIRKIERGDVENHQEEILNQMKRLLNLVQAEIKKAKVEV